MRFFSRHVFLRVVILGFLAGAVSTLVFHQLTIGLLNAMGVVSSAPYSFRPTAPLGVPSVLNLAFWGAIWGLLWASVAHRDPFRWPTWFAGFLFGAIGPTFVGWFVIAPLKGLPIAQGFNPARMWIAPLINGMWGLGTAIVLDLLRRR